MKSLCCLLTRNMNFIKFLFDFEMKIEEMIFITCTMLEHFPALHYSAVNFRISRAGVKLEN